MKAIRLSVNCSPVLYELTVRDVINFLCHDFNEEIGVSGSIEIDNKLTELFQCFEISKMIPVLNVFFEVRYF